MERFIIRFSCSLFFFFFLLPQKKKTKKQKNKKTKRKDKKKKKTKKKRKKLNTAQVSYYRSVTCSALTCSPEISAIQVFQHAMGSRKICNHIIKKSLHRALSLAFKLTLARLSGEKMVRCDSMIERILLKYHIT